VTAARRLGGWAVRNCAAAVSLLTAYPANRLAAQDTSVVDRGVRVGIIYRPGVRPGMVLLPGRPAVLDSVRAIVARDLDYSDRFEMITLPGGDSIRLGAAANPTRSSDAGGPGGGAARRRGSTTRCSRPWARTSRSRWHRPPTRRSSRCTTSRPAACAAR